MASLLKRLPSFRRSASAASTSNGDAGDQQHSRTSIDGKGQEQTLKDSDGWNISQSTSYISGLDVNDLREVLVKLAEEHEVVRTALHKHYQQQDSKGRASRPALQHANHSMNKKRRAETELDKEDVSYTATGGAAVDTLQSATIVSPDLNTLEEVKAGEGAGINTALATVATPQPSETVIIEGQSGMVVLPTDTLNEASEGTSAKSTPAPTQPAPTSNMPATSNSERRERASSRSKSRQ